MRMLMQIAFPPEPFNTAVRDGTVGEKMKKILDAIRPEAAYFTEQDGERGAVLVVEVGSPSDVPRLAEPWFLTFEASMNLRICMTAEDLEKADLEGLGEIWG